MKIKEISAGVKVSRNYDSYQVGFIAEVGDGEDCDEVGRVLMEKALKVVESEVAKIGDRGRGMNGSSMPSAEKKGKNEVGAAWVSRKMKNFLSVKIDGKWADVPRESLVAANEGYELKIGDDVFYFKEVRERGSEKMPVFRIYRT